ncbi:hypothetical protein BLNAU_12780 [Blattamonas nauphoetae]|uniref:Uncharacterized protein n=1 Tax=Blattamonas nauphoetae TaxID=2049346 RepID=A0ABQ9XIG1_9EUKA|nr:hypothetical protein BLNAU_12780 [Blattamonas nauphoetae]
MKVTGSRSVEIGGTDYRHRLVSKTIHSVPTQLQTLPQLDFTDPPHFFIDRTSITRTSLGRYIYGLSFWSSALLSDPFSAGVVSLTITILKLPTSSVSLADFFFGLMDSNNPIPANGRALGNNVQYSISLSSKGHLFILTPPSRSFRYCHSNLHEGDCVRMEVDLDSTPRTVQFFVNGEAGKYYVSGIPSSVRIGV